jgi:2-C-methyl-D-erythritol 4-phosphate cytidylyltransferase
MSAIYGIILAGGKGTRLGDDTPKQFLPLGDKPILLWSLEAFRSLEKMSGIIIVSPCEYLARTEEIIQQHQIQGAIEIIAGGISRQESSYNAVRCKDFNNDDILILHDAARPFVSASLISQCIEETEIHGAAAVYVRATDTVTEVRDNWVQAIPEREILHCAQTPQSFKYHFIKQAHEHALKREITGATDDVSLALLAGFAVRAVTGDYQNIKITTPFDYELAQYMITLRS